MDNNEQPERKERPKGSWVGIGITLGLPIGAALGLALNNLALVAGVGLLVGIVVGGFLEARPSSDKK